MSEYIYLLDIKIFWIFFFSWNIIFDYISLYIHTIYIDISVRNSHNFNVNKILHFLKYVTELYLICLMKKMSDASK